MISSIKDISSIAQSLVTIGAIIVAAVWFFLTREHVPRANITLDTQTVDLTRDNFLVSAVAHLENTGSIDISLDEAIARIDVLRPNLGLFADGDYEALKKNRGQFRFYTVCRRIIDIESNWIEPGEAHSIAVDFLVPKGIEVIRFVFFVENQTATGQHDIRKGWSSQSIIRFQHEERKDGTAIDISDFVCSRDPVSN